MKISTKTIIKLVIIGTFHATVFLWLIPFVILPSFDGINSGRAVTVVVMFTAFITAVIFFYPAYNRRKISGNKGANFQCQKKTK